MIATLGNFSIWLSLLFAFTQFVSSLQKNNKKIIKFNTIAAIGLLLFSMLSFLCLIYSYIVSDFSVSNVFQNSHTTKPLIYKISAVWGNHEGSMLLWILVLAIFNFFIFKLYNKINFSFVTNSLKIQAFVTLGFLFFTLLTSNPFEKIFPVPENGLGFNPILQDPALAIHPPLLYIGYVGFSAAFSFSVAILLGKDKKLENNILLFDCMRPFVLAAWTFLTIGIAFGSIWAYYELGWGGWWFWDPVENASFMPWLLGTALVHSLIAVKKKKILQKWVLLLAILSFLLSVIGTFLVRSGILTSVHAFALDPSRGIYILAFIAIIGTYSLTLFFLNSKKFSDKKYVTFLSREGSILINNIIMIIVCASVFLGTVYPLIIESFTGNKISVGEPYYNSIVVPIMIPALIVMGVGPLLSWNDINFTKLLKNSFPNFIFVFINTTFFVWIFGSFNIFGLIGIILFSWILSNIIFTLISNYSLIKSLKALNKNKIPKITNSMLIAHVGVALLILGVTASSVWQKEKIIRMKTGESIKINNYQVVFKELNEIKGENYFALQGKFLVYDKKKLLITELNPENRIYPITNNSTTEAAIHTNLKRDLYIVLGDGNSDKGRVIRIYYNPLVIWIWIGALLIFMGGLISMKNNYNPSKNSI